MVVATLVVVVAAATVVADLLLGLTGAVVTSVAAALAGLVTAVLLSGGPRRPHEVTVEAIDSPERELMASVVDFPDTVAREVMVPRPDMVTVSADFRVVDVIEVMLLNGYSRLPVCGEGIDDVLGLAYAKDLMGATRDGKEEHHVTEVMRPAMFVPETTRLPELLRQMQEEQFHMAVVLDEYGGTAGLITLEDIIEELVGEIHDEFDVEESPVEALPGGDALVRGRTPLDEVNELLGADLPQGDWDTVGGLITSRLGHVPVEGESVEVAGWRLTAQRIQGRRIGRVRMSRVPANLANDAGQVGGAEVLPLAVLLFVVVTLVVVNAWGVVDAKLAADAAAREAARSYVEAQVTDVHGADGAERAAVESGLDTIDAHGRDPSRARVWLSGLDGPGGAGSYDRCARVRFTASYHVPAIQVPWLGGLGNGFEVTSSHSELVDRYRDGVPGDTSAC